MDWIRRLKAGATGLVMAAATGVSATAQADIAQSPLFTTANANPAVLFNMSIENPMGGAAYNDSRTPADRGMNLPDASDPCRQEVVVGMDSDGDPILRTVGRCYSNDTRFVGYFDPEKCYDYSTSNGGYFDPAGSTNNGYQCTSGSGGFSGNFLNWATLTAMDMFVWTTTGGNRVVDTTTQTIIQRTRKHDNDAWFPIKALGESLNVKPNTVTPWSNDPLFIENTAFGVEFKSSPDGDPFATRSVQLEVCDPSVGIESNCVAYDEGAYYKPEGLVQSNADDMRFAVTSYTDDDGNDRDGGVLRANMKYVGPTLPDGSTNNAAEFTADGLLTYDPDNLTGSAGVEDSGVIKYLNRFSEFGYKSKDPASELFYESIRYFKNLGATPEYSNGLSSDEKGGFPVITDWEDPVAASCQRNFIVGINDANPWKDKRLPGTAFTGSTYGGEDISDDSGEPSNPDPDINVTELTNTVGSLQGLNGSTQPYGCNASTCPEGEATVPALGEIMGTFPYYPKENSYYIAGLAYYGNTQDIRPDFEGEQNVSTFMIDTQEFQDTPLTGEMNMLWLAGKYGGFIDENNNDEPDLQTEWDVDADGSPDNYVLATESQRLVAGLNRAFNFIKQQSASSAPLASNTGIATQTLTRLFQPVFVSGLWYGKLLAYEIKADGSPGTVVWDAGKELADEDWDSEREIITYNPDTGEGVPFRYGDLSTAQQDALDTNYTTSTVDDKGIERVRYLRGDTSEERQNGGLFRDRPVIDGEPRLLGDIVNSAPVYVGSDTPFGWSRLDPEGSDYTSFSPSRDKLVYAGANDGMVHAFAVDDGEEVFAYAPGAIVENMNRLTAPTAAHRYFVDSTPTYGDAYFDDTVGSAEWRSVLVGGLGGGGQAVYALDITDITKSFTESSTSARDLVLWELSDADQPDLGYSFSRPAIVRMANGEWMAVFGNGYANTEADGNASTTGHAKLFFVDIEDGSVVHTVEMPGHGSTTAPNGLPTVAPADPDQDGVVEAIYAGDLKGNLWKVDVDSSNTGKWSIPFGTSNSPIPLFEATDADTNGDPQPITVAPRIAKHPTNEGVMLYFGTGKYFEENDDDVTLGAQTQTFYAIWDPGPDYYDSKGPDLDRTDLVKQEIMGTSTADSGDAVRVPTDKPVEWFDPASGNNSTPSVEDWGWYIDLPANGERVVTRAVVRANRVLFSTLIPSQQACSYGGTGWLMALDAATGGRLSVSPFDVSTTKDGVFNDQDLVSLPGDPDDEQVPGGGIKSGIGILSAPTILAVAGNPAGIAEACRGEVASYTGSSGATETQCLNTGRALGRQSWRELR